MSLILISLSFVRLACVLILINEAKQLCEEAVEKGAAVPRLCLSS